MAVVGDGRSPLSQHCDVVCWKTLGLFDRTFDVLVLTDGLTLLILLGVSPLLRRPKMRLAALFHQEVSSFKYCTYCDCVPVSLATANFDCYD